MSRNCERRSAFETNFRLQSTANRWGWCL